MRGMSFLMDQAVKLREPKKIPESRLERTVEGQSNWLDDEITEAFERACAMGELVAADDLLTVLEKWHARRTYHSLSDKQTRVTALKRLSGELERRHLMKGTRRERDGAAV